MKLKSITERWEEFAADVLTEDASPVLREEMRQAYIAGFSSCLHACCIELDSFPEEDARAQVDAWAGEIVSLAREIQRRLHADQN